MTIAQSTAMKILALIPAGDTAPLSWGMKCIAPTNAIFGSGLAGIWPHCAGERT